MNKTTRYGLIGCGMMGQEHLKNIALLPKTAVTVIFEPDAAMREIARRLAPQARFVNTLEDLLAQDALDCLVITSPNFRHAEQMLEIAAKRPLPLLVEKPLLTDPADIPRLKNVAATYPAPIWVAMEYRYMPPIAELLKRAPDITGGVRMLSIREHRFPFLQKVDNWNRFNDQTGGTFVEKCCHFFDLMRLVMGSKPIRIMASAAQSVNHLDECYGGAVPDIIDNGYVIVDFEGGQRAMLELCMFAEGARFQETLSAVGVAGKIEAFVPGPTRFWPGDLGPPPIPVVEISPRTPKRPTILEIPVDQTLLAAGDHNGATFYQHRGFLELVQTPGARPEVSFEDGLWAVEMGMAAQLSASTRRAVDL
ncbi:Inositol 2-dehydrogenase/D-chiro-inositol 3-dehydrogenase [Roseobacter fucihabitans]|uniref:Inositol 2-dehydrogenase/D-chiro-inositol 3-dehydrogenase n=1 Tax=Roseobacter fucihabitans TaxID=1537242 RepID=A0ABZ2BPS4_9RHOB|nr:Gfo/Idh/MocA family oxidoreductase [Roseobacter litoralis]MBC6965538.1 Inositol 2-dehydrogenase [Roseobacter litoralis]